MDRFAALAMTGINRDGGNLTGGLSFMRGTAKRPTDWAKLIFSKTGRDGKRFAAGEREPWHNAAKYVGVYCLTRDPCGMFRQVLRDTPRQRRGKPHLPCLRLRHCERGRSNPVSDIFFWIVAPPPATL
jgi:hypothetical protein